MCERRQRRVRGGAQEIAQAGERKLCLRALALAMQDVVAALARRRQHRPPQRGLADPGLALEYQPGGPVRQAVEHRGGHLELPLTPDYPRAGMTHSIDDELYAGQQT